MAWQAARDAVGDSRWPGSELDQLGTERAGLRVRCGRVHQRQQRPASWSGRRRGLVERRRQRGMAGGVRCPGNLRALPLRFPGLVWAGERQPVLDARRLPQPADPSIPGFGPQQARAGSVYRIRSAGQPATVGIAEVWHQPVPGDQHDVEHHGGEQHGLGRAKGRVLHRHAACLRLRRTASPGQSPGTIDPCGAYVPTSRFAGLETLKEHPKKATNRALVSAAR